MGEVTQGPCRLCVHQETPHVICHACLTKIRHALQDIPDYYALSAGEFWPAGAGSGGKGSERSIGLRVEALDVRSDRAALEALEGWERIFRWDFDDSSEDAAALVQRERKAQRWADSKSQDFHGVNLVGVCEWLLTHLERIQDHPAVDEFWAEVREVHKRAREAARDRGEAVTVVQCPADYKGTLCRKSLTLDADRVPCPRCGTEWDRPRLLLVARSADVDTWQPAAVVSEHFGIPARTLRSWAQAGHVRRRGVSYLWSSVVAHVQTVREQA